MTRLRHHYTLFLLFMVSAVNLIDRQIMGIVIEPIKVEFGVSDTQIGLLTGLGFSLVYCLCALPMGRLADRTNRRNVIGLCCAFWSVMTGLCGLATSYWGLALARLGVAAGESGSGAASLSIIADLYPPKQRAMAISFFMLGAPIGVLLGMSLGGWIAYYHGWRAAFAWMALPGLVTAVVLWLSTRDPRRGTWEPNMAGPVAQESLWAVLCGAWASSPFVRIAIAGALLAFSGYAFSIWSTAFLVRSHGLTLKDAGILIGLAAGPAAIIGTLSSGWITARLVRRDPRWQLGVPIIGSLLAFPLAIGFAFSPVQAYWLVGSLKVPQAVAFIFGLSVFGMWWMAPSYAAIAQVVAPQRRATLIAVYNFGIMALGAGFGPLLVGLLSDCLHGIVGASALSWALALCASGYLLACAVLLSVLEPYNRAAREHEYTSALTSC
ncbi:putative L-galactonate transporter [Pseudomonas fluorescens]|nr:putative L-galactonate transporter [Pseudomonas fluorescens]